MSSETPNVRLIVQYFDDIEAEPIRWLWKGRIAKGTLTLLVGPSGVGKSQVGAYLAAMVSSGNGSEAGLTNPPGRVFILSSEDIPSQITKPRLAAAGADMRKIAYIDQVEETNQKGELIKRKLILRRDMDALEGEIAKAGDVSLLLIDPIAGYLGVNSHNSTQVRALLESLIAIALRYDFAIVAVAHPHKGGGSAIDRAMGSAAFVATSRAAHLVCKDRDDPELRLFLPIKINIGNDSTGLAFRIENVEFPGDIETSRIVWQPDVVKVSADEALAAHINPLVRKAVEEAKAFLQEALGQGPRLTKDLKEDANGMGIPWATVRRAQKLLGIKPVKIDFQGGWMWFIPGIEEADPDEDDLPQT